MIAKLNDQQSIRYIMNIGTWGPNFKVTLESISSSFLWSSKKDSIYSAERFANWVTGKRGKCQMQVGGDLEKTVWGHRLLVWGVTHIGRRRTLGHPFQLDITFSPKQKHKESFDT